MNRLQYKLEILATKSLYASTGKKNIFIKIPEVLDIKNFQQRDCIFLWKEKITIKIHWLVGLFSSAFLPVCLTLPLESVFAVLLFLGAQINHSLLGVLKSVFATFSWAFFLFFYKWSLSLWKRGGYQYCSVKWLYLGKSVGGGRVSFFLSQGSCFFFFAGSIRVCISLSRLGLMHAFTPHKPTNSDQIGAASGPCLRRRYVSWEFKGRRLYIAKTLVWLILQGILFHTACIQPGKCRVPGGHWGR